MAPTVMWFRRDLRLSDNPALVDAVRHAGDDGVVALFCLDQKLLARAGAPRRRYLSECARSLDASIAGRLTLARGDPVRAVTRVARDVGAAAVYAAADFGPYGVGRDDRVARALEHAGIEFVRTGSPYAVAPGTVRSRNDEPYRVFTPFLRAWEEIGWPKPIRAPSRVRWLDGIESCTVPDEPLASVKLPAAGEGAARRAARRFWDDGLDRYDHERDRPAADSTSRLSPHLRFGTIHPRQLLAKLDRSPAHTRFRAELAWREFYADVLFDRPETVRASYQPKMATMRVDTGLRSDERFAAWAEGRTGYPFVDAGMRQLLAEAWMHNRVRMVVASFLVKDLHLDWTRGAAHFMQHLVDGDLASNQHGWQWTAGTGTDAAPYFRVFNPVAQGERFDPDGGYVRRWIPELRHLSDRYIHRPWDDPAGRPAGYPPPIVEHEAERAEALRRYGEVTTRNE